MGQPPRLGGGAGHVEGRQSQRLGHIVGQLGVNAALEQDGLALDIDAVDGLVDGLDPVDLQRGQGQADQRGDLVADLQVAVGEVLADVGHLADEHAAGAGDRVLLLAALGHDAEDHLADLLLVAAAGFLDLGEGGGIDVQADHIADDLIGVMLAHIVVNLPRGLGEHALRLNDAVGAVLVAL